MQQQTLVRGPAIYKSRTTTSRATQRNRIGYMLLAPALLIHVAVVGIPSILTLAFSTLDWNIIGPMRFIGLANFREIFADDHVFRMAFVNNVRWLIFFLTVPMVLGMAAALVLSHIERGQIIYRTVLFLPYILSSVIVGRLFQSLYHPFYGINLILEAWGLDGLTRTWLGDPNVALYAVATASTWHWWPFPMVVFLGALQQIDRTLYESASIEGADGWQSFRYVTLPLLRPTLIFLLLMTLIWGFMTFDYIYVMTKGGPGNSTEVMATWIYTQAVDFRRAGYASALAVMLGLITAGVIAGYTYLRRRGWEV
jgi:raffinose/stachyose/melibiose transport system permease protein